MLVIFYVFKTTHNKPFGLVLAYVNEASVMVHNDKYSVYSIYIYIYVEDEPATWGDTIPEADL